MASFVPMSAPASRLFTDAPGEVRSQTETSAQGSVTTFTHVRPGAEPRSLGSVSSHSREGRGRTAIRWAEPRGAPPEAAEAKLLGLERFYAHVLQQDPTGWFEFDTTRGAVRALKASGRTQGDALRAIAEARNRAARELVAARSTLKPMTWRIVSVKPARASRSDDPDQVTVRLLDAKGKPVAAAMVGATRGADMMCQARSDPRGIASCKLIDTHGHAPDEHGDDDPTIVTFPGIVAADAIDLPTTLRIEPAAKPHRHKH